MIFSPTTSEPLKIMTWEEGWKQYKWQFREYPTKTEFYGLCCPDISCKVSRQNYLPHLPHIHPSNKTTDIYQWVMYCSSCDIEYTSHTNYSFDCVLEHLISAKSAHEDALTWLLLQGYLTKTLVRQLHPPLSQ